jgi:hypothetical protein
MKKDDCGLLVLGTLLAALFVIGTVTQAAARVDVNVNIGLPPPYMIPAPPPVVVIPGTYVYAIPDVEVEILFYHGYWYRPYEGRWHRARSYNGPWVYCVPSSVPRALMELPPGHYRVPPGYHHIPYGQVKKNWGKWEREQHWASDRDWREGGHGKPEGRGGEERGKGHEGREHGKGH